MGHINRNTKTHLQSDWETHRASLNTDSFAHPTLVGNKSKVDFDIVEQDQATEKSFQNKGSPVFSRSLDFLSAPLFPLYTAQNLTAYPNWREDSTDLIQNNTN